MDRLIFVLELNRHILQLCFEISDFSVDAVFAVTCNEAPGQLGEDCVLELSLEPIVNDSDNPDLAVGFYEPPVPDNRLKSFLLMSFNHCLEFPRKLEVSPLQNSGNKLLS